MWRTLKFILLLVVITATNSVFAQETPSVEINLSQPTAQQGDVITADVVVRGAVNVSGADIGIAVNDECLRIIERQQGGFLPSPEEGGSFSAFSALDDQTTRLAIAITDRSQRANGDGVFYSVQLEVTCIEGAASVTLTFAQLGAYDDPNAEEVAIIPYEVSRGNLKTSDAQLTIAPAAQMTAVPTDVVSATPTVSADATPAPMTETQAPQSNQTVLIIVIVLVMVTLIGLILFALVRYLRRR